MCTRRTRATIRSTRPPRVICIMRGLTRVLVERNKIRIPPALTILPILSFIIFFKKFKRELFPRNFSNPLFNPVKTPFQKSTYLSNFGTTALFRVYFPASFRLLSKWNCCPSAQRRKMSLDLSKTISELCIV